MENTRTLTCRMKLTPLKMTPLWTSESYQEPEVENPRLPKTGVFQTRTRRECPVRRTVVFSGRGFQPLA